MRRASVKHMCMAALALSMLSVDAWAQAPDGDVERARELSSTAEELFQKGDYKGAIEAIEKAERHVHSLGHTLLSARAHAKLRKLVDAQRLYREILAADAARIKPPPRVQSWKWTPAQRGAQAEATKELLQLTPRIPFLKVIVSGADPSALTVTIDGEPLDVAQLDQETPRDPGRHTIVAEAPGKNKATREVDLEEGAKQTATLELTPVVIPVKPASVPVGTIVAFGVGGAGLLVWAVAGGIAIAQTDMLRGECPDLKCRHSSAPLYDSALAASRASTVGLGVALAGAGAGTLLWFAPWEKASSRPVGVAVGIGSLTVSGRF